LVSAPRACRAKQELTGDGRTHFVAAAARSSILSDRYVANAHIRIRPEKNDSTSIASAADAMPLRNG